MFQLFGLQCVCVCVFVCVSVMQNDLNNNKVSVRDCCKRVGS